MLHTPSCHPHSQDIMSATLVAHPLISPRSPYRSRTLLTAEGPRWSSFRSERWKLPGRIGGRSRIDGALPARKVEGQDTTPGPVSVEQDFAGEEPEAVEEDLVGGESGPSADDSPDGLAEQGTTRGLEHQVKIDQFQAFISRLSQEKGAESWICKNCTL